MSALTWTSDINPAQKVGLIQSHRPRYLLILYRLINWQDSFVNLKTPGATVLLDSKKHGQLNCQVAFIFPIASFIIFPEKIGAQNSALCHHIFICFLVG